MLRTTSRCEAPGLRPLRITPQLQAAFAFTVPLGLVHPMACAHVKLLGPCFKTGQRGRRPTRDRDADRDGYHSLKETAPIPAPARARNHGLARSENHTNFTKVLGPTRAVRRVRLQAKCRRHPIQQRSRVIADPEPQSFMDVTLNRHSRLREPLRLLLHSFTYF